LKRHLLAAAGVALLFSTNSASPQVSATAAPTTPDLPYEAVPNFFQAPPGDYMGELQGVATNSKGHTFAYFRGPQTRLWEFGTDGKFIKEIGKGFYGFQFAHSVRVDRHDNIWTVDEGTNVVTKFNPTGTKVLMVIGHRPSQAEGPYATPKGNVPDSKYPLCRPTDVAWDSQDNIFISDGYCNNRVVKYSPEGRFITKVGSEKPGKGLGEFNLPHGMQVDQKGNVWVADRSNFRYQVLDNNLKPIKEITNLGVGWTACASGGAHQYMFLSNSNPNGNGPGTWETTGEIYKVELDGTVVGKFGKPGKLAPGLQVMHMMDCRNPDRPVLGEIESWRVQRYILQPTNAKAASAQ
jgi:sugar lactone lactonase YvrE